MLRTVGKTSLPHIVDVGTGVGLIPWLLCAEGDPPRSVDLFEPRKSGRTALQRLWNYGRVGEYTVAYLGGDNVPFSRPADLIMFCHCLFHIDQRQTVLRRAWQALKPGGVLLVNEMPKEAGGADRLRDALLTRNEIVAGMPGTPRLFSARTGWRTAHEPHAGSARAIGSSGLFVSVKD
jgi:SAM-dependent methyltransferase